MAETPRAGIGLPPAMKWSHWRDVSADMALPALWSSRETTCSTFVRDATDLGRVTKPRLDEA